MGWIWWLGAVLLLAVVEMLSLDLVLIMFAGGAAVAAVLAALGLPLWVQIIGFGATSGLLLLALRPWLLRHLRHRVPLVETNAAALVGRVAVVVAPVSERAGRVKLTGEVWTARTENDEVVDVGHEERVVRIDGATAVVTARLGAQAPRHERVHDPSVRLDRPSEETAQ
jgi:membrane protein implicated in regulation of membrane protease activity